MAVVVFVFRGFRDAQYTAAAEAEIVGCFGSIERFADYFSGYASYRDWMSGQRFFGVWGSRNCARFRRMLGEWGQGVDVAHCSPPGYPRSAERRWKRLTLDERLGLEADIKRGWSPRTVIPPGPE
jgi:hypothetical protein